MEKDYIWKGHPLKENRRLRAAFAPPAQFSTLQKTPP
jgi:hypothetical protein